jgi:hypothetical protein
MKETLETQVCTKCRLNKPLSEYQFRKDTQKHRRDCKDCQSKYQKIYQKANLEKERARVIAWQKANPERCKANRKAWKEANLEKVKANRKAYYEENETYNKTGFVPTVKNVVLILPSVEQLSHKQLLLGLTYKKYKKFISIVHLAIISITCFLLTHPSCAVFT